MNSCIILTYYILIIFILKISICSKIISIPFKFASTKSNYFKYNSSDFFNEYYTKVLLLQMNIGTSPQKVNAYLNPNSYCFEFKSSENNYFPYNSSSFNTNQNKITNPQKGAFNYITSNDIITFNTNESYKMSFVTMEELDIGGNKNISLIPEIGINNPAVYYGYFYLCNNFIDDLKKMKAIDNKIFSVKYNNRFGGEFVLGDVLSKYDNKHFMEEEYSTNYFSYDFKFIYDNIFMKYPWNKTEYLNITGNSNKKEAIINLNSGLIIGTEDFKNFIDKIFFKYLIEKNICRMDLVILDENKNKVNRKLGNEFYLYSCSHIEFTGQVQKRYETIDRCSEFPNLTFHSKSFEYDFELTNNDLFEQIYSRDYFLIAFPKKIKDQENKDIWYLGEPFYKKYPFTINLDAKTIGFYLDKKNTYKKINETKNIIIDNKEKEKEIIIIENNNSKIKNILIRVVEIIVGIGLIILAYYIGMKVKEGRKKRANELKDDSYEYISDDNKDINNESRIENKNKQFVELNSKLGL